LVEGKSRTRTSQGDVFGLQCGERREAGCGEVGWRECGDVELKKKELVI
jgi:hypothetical protein